MLLGTESMAPLAQSRPAGSPRAGRLLIMQAAGRAVADNAGTGPAASLWLPDPLALCGMKS